MSTQVESQIPAPADQSTPKTVKGAPLNYVASGRQVVNGIKYVEKPTPPAEQVTNLGPPAK